VAQCRTTSLVQARPGLLPLDQWPSDAVPRAYKRPTRLGALTARRLRGVREQRQLLRRPRWRRLAIGELRRGRALAQMTAGLTGARVEGEDGPML
jgi:hypothetical protein